MAYALRLNQAQYLPGDPIEIALRTDHDIKDRPKIVIYRLHEPVSIHYDVNFKDEICQIVIHGLEIGNYGIIIELDGKTYRTACDVVSSEKDIVRYGFLSDFSREHGHADLDFMRDLHINAVQFYDWMYRHDQLISPENTYEDPLGRPTDLSVIKQKIERAKSDRIRPFAYGAIYAATPALFHEHPDWGLYALDGSPLLFDSWLHFMNVSTDSKWSEYIISQFEDAIDLGFMGIHMDTYGFPKVVSDKNGKTFSLADTFFSLINRTDRRVCSKGKENGVIFNAVNNWPIERIAQSRQDSIYIEVWPPHDTYQDLYRLIREARMLGGKHVILAAYMHPFKDAETAEDTRAAERSLLLTQAVINSSGGTQLVFGEEQGVLCDSYYVNYAHMEEPFTETIRRYQDHLVRYADLLYNDTGMDVSMTASGGINDDIRFGSSNASFSPNGKPNTVWTIIREKDERLTINLINLLGQDDLWNTPKNTINPVKDIRMIFRLDRKVKGIYAASPDSHEDILTLPFHMTKTNRGRQYECRLPALHIWSTVWLETES